MSNMPNRMRRAAVAALLPLTLSCALAVPGFAGAQSAPQDPRVQITPAQASTFFSAFTALAQQAHVALVAEDQPLHPALTPASVARLKLTQDGEPLSTLLPKLATAYDYDVQPSSKVLLLKKRYTDAADLPSITVQECALALEETTRYAENFNPHLVLGLPDRSPVIRDLIYSLTPEQLQAMGDNKRGVPVTSLTLVQQQEVQQFLLHLYVQTAINDLPNTVGFLGRVSATDPKFSWRAFVQLNPLLARFDPQGNVRLFGYDATLASGKPLFITMSKPDQVKVQLDGGVRTSPRQVSVSAPAIPQVNEQIMPGDITDPLPALANAPTPAPPVSSSLGDILTQMNVRATGGVKGDGLKVTIQPYLAPKRATVFGAEVTTPRQEVAALADVYGLRVLTEKEQGHDRLRLTRRTPTASLDMTALHDVVGQFLHDVVGQFLHDVVGQFLHDVVGQFLHDVVGQFLPDPLVRAYRMHPTYAPFDPNSPVPPDTSPLLVYAVRQIRTAAEPKIRASKDGSVALSALSEQEGRAFAVVLMADALDSLRGLLTAEPPKELTHFSELRLSGGLRAEDGKQHLTLLLALPSPGDPSTLQAGIGVGGINYDPINHTF